MGICNPYLFKYPRIVELKQRCCCAGPSITARKTFRVVLKYFTNKLKRSFYGMKIAYTGLNLPQGKIKFHDGIFEGLVEKYQPAKVSPYYFEFLSDDYESADIIAIADENVLDMLIFDLENTET